MDSNKYLQMAVQAFQQGKQRQGLEAMERAAEMGNANAVLYLADVYFMQDRLKCYQYLKQQWHKGVPGTLHRLVLKKVFFAGEKIDQECAGYLLEEAFKGHMESMLVCINFLQESQAGYSYLLHKIANVSSELLQDLGLPEPAVEDVEPNNLQIEALAGQLANAWLATTEFDRTLLDERIELTKIPGFLSNLEVAYLKLRNAQFLKPSIIVDPVTGEYRQDPIRDSLTANINPELMDWFSLDIDRRIALATNTPLNTGETQNILHYGKGQQYKPHYDAFTGSGQGNELLLSDGGQRATTAIVYLSEVDKGGQTAFPKLALSVPPEPGTLVYFRNVDADGNLLKGSYHAGKPVEAGEKWILTKWIRSGPTQYGKMLYSSVA